LSNPVPDIKKCPRCGNPIFIGETECSRCGYNVATAKDRLRNLSPIPIATVMTLMGIFLVFLAFGEDDNLTKFIFFLLGGGGIVGAGLVYTFLTFFNDPMRKRK
jgi:hypothetical protein